MPSPQCFVLKSTAYQTWNFPRFTPEPKAGHTGCMELYTLRLRAPLSWTPAAITPTDVAPGTTSADPDTTSADPGKVDPGIGMPVLTREGSEAVFIWNREQLVADNDDGPHLCLPLQPPLQAGIAEGSVDATGNFSRIELPAGSYLFCQGRLKDITSIEQTLEWFLREAWWTRAECRDPVYLRLIHEDGKTAVQVIMESVKQD